MNDINIFAKTNFRGHEHKFGIKTDDRRRHIYVIGKTGMGKTTLLENMALNDIRSGKGVAIVDPHGDFAEKILKFIPSQRTNEVIYFNPSDADYPIAFNVMEKVDPQYQHLVCSGLISVFKKIWADSWGPRLEYLLRNTLLALLEYPNSTLLGVNRMLVDKEYRKKVVSRVSDPVIRSFWEDEFTKYSNQFATEAISPIQNKVGQFLSNPMVRNIVGQTKSSIDMREIIDNQRILVINLSKGRIGEDYSALLGAMLITKIQLAVMSRVDIPEKERKDFYLYVDEFQNFATESFADILSEARKYRLNLIIAHQYIGQLEEKVSDAVFGNVGTIISFRVGAADAEILEKEFAPVFYINDIVNLGKYDIYLKLMIDGIAGDAFSATTLPSPDISETKNEEKIIKISRERYSIPRKIVEEKIVKWAGVETEKKNDEVGLNAKKNKEETRAENKTVIEKEKKMWEAKCDRCGRNIQVPFEPDPNRKTYCKECLAQVRKEIALAMKSKEMEENKEPQFNNFSWQSDQIKQPPKINKAEINSAKSEGGVNDISVIDSSGIINNGNKKDENENGEEIGKLGNWEIKEKIEIGKDIRKSKSGADVNAGSDETEKNNNEEKNEEKAPTKKGVIESGEVVKF